MAQDVKVSISSPKLIPESKQMIEALEDVFWDHNIRMKSSIGNAPIKSIPPIDIDILVGFVAGRYVLDPIVSRGEDLLIEWGKVIYEKWNPIQRIRFNLQVENSDFRVECDPPLMNKSFAAEIFQNLNAILSIAQKEIPMSEITKVRLIGENADVIIVVYKTARPSYVVGLQEGRLFEVDKELLDRYDL